MAVKKYSDWIVDRSKKFGQVMAFGGSERVRIDEALLLIRQKVLTAAADFNHDRINGPESDFSSIVSAANTLPMMADMRLIEIRQAEGLKEDLEPFLEYITAPCSTSILVLIFDHVDLRQKLPKALAAQNQLYVFDAPKEFEMPQIIAEYLKKHELKCSSEAANLLAITVGTDISFLENALLKLSVAVANKNVQADDIEKHLKGKNHDAFTFGRLVANADKPRALTLLCNLQNEQEVPLKLVGLLAWQLRQILRCRSLFDQGLTASAIEKKLALFGQNKDFLRIAQKGSLQWHIYRLTRLNVLDRELKSLPGSPWLYFEKCIIDLCKLNEQ